MHRRQWRVAIITIMVGIIAFTAYLGTLFRQVEKSFVKPESFVPTRIYSDVTRIAPSEGRQAIESRLNRLGYRPQLVENQMQFRLRKPDYPAYLIPDNHPVFDAGDKTVSLSFDGSSKDSLLETIKIGTVEASDLYLEPELVATLGRSGQEEGSRQIRDTIPFSEIPAPIWKAIIAIEDQHFLEHSGFDPRGIARAIWINLRTRSFAQGGSTITQQLVKNLSGRRTRNLVLKINEFFLALVLEARFDKEKILERYLNEVYLGQVGNLEVHGVSEGAQHFFGKRLDELNLAETAMMAGLIRGPGFYSPYRYPERARDRMKLVLRKMAETGQVAEAEATAALSLPVRFAPPVSLASRAPYFIDYVKAELIRQLKSRLPESDITHAGLRVYTTLDPLINSAGQKAIAQVTAELEKRFGGENQRLEGALAAVDQSTGYIRALIGGKNYAQSNFNRILNMKRQVGSTFKPIVYLAAMNDGKDSQGTPYTPGYPMEDNPWKLIFDHGRQTWEPHNYEGTYLGWIPLQTALAHSVNTVAAKLGHSIGNRAIIDAARALGIQSDLPDVPSLPLGVAELSPIELLRVYSTLANHGSRDDLTVIRGITHDDGTDFARFVYHPTQVFPAGPADLLTDMLQLVFTEGTAHDAYKLGFERPAAGKTGTTSEYRDAWFAGYTPQLTAVVWVGSDQDHAPPDAQGGKKAKKKGRLTGANSALPIWTSFMKEALAGEPPLVFQISPVLSAIKLDRRTGNRATSSCPDDKVIITKVVLGHEPSKESCEANWPPTTRETVGP